MTYHCGRPNRTHPLEKPGTVPRWTRRNSTIEIKGYKFRRLPEAGRPRPRYEDAPAEFKARALETIRANKDRFAPDLAGESDVDLSISGFFLTARRRQQATSA